MRSKISKRLFTAVRWSCNDVTTQMLKSYQNQLFIVVCYDMNESRNSEERVNPQTVFCFLLVEEFLMKNNMTSTLDSFRQEWKRPDDMTSSLSWYEIATKLHLPEMIDQSPSNTIIETMTSALCTESSIKSRKKQDIVLSGLAELPREKSFPYIESAKADELEIFKESKELQLKTYSYLPSSTLPPAKLIRQEPTQSNANFKKSKMIRRQIEAQAGGKVKASSENWIPEIQRLRSIYRDIVVAEANLNDAIVLETEQKREMRRFQTSDIDKAHLEEELGSKRKMVCACCLQKYSYVNLPTKVPIKAIIDIRKKWSNNKIDGWWCADDERLSAVPRCYDGVKICTFCSQFFDEQEKYRPSFSSITMGLRRKAHEEAKKREREYWDPLLMCEKDRELIAEMERLEMLTNKSNNSTTKDNIVLIEPSLSTIEYE